MTAGALKVPESRIIAHLLLCGLAETTWKDAIYGQNVLQTRSPKTAARLTLLLRGRLTLMEAALWRLVRDGSGTVATQACLAAAVKHSALLGDFLDLVVREHYTHYAKTLSNTVWDHYLLDCRGRDPAMPQWSMATVARLRSSVFQILAQAGYIASTRTLRLQPVYLASPVLNYLTAHQEGYVLRCLQVAR
jgi:hypothetical protein